MGEGLGKLTCISEWIDDYDLVPHYHGNEPCHNWTCNLWFWNDPMVQKMIPLHLKRWAEGDLLKTIAVMLPYSQQELQASLDALTGPTIAIRRKEKKPIKIRLMKIMVWVSAILGGGGVIGISFKYFFPF